MTHRAIYFLIGVVAGAIFTTALFLSTPQRAPFGENVRGYVRCVDGHWRAGNFDIIGQNASGAPFFNLEKDCVEMMRGVLG